MRFPLILNLLFLTTLSSASLFPFQQPLHKPPVNNLHPALCIKSFLPTARARCPPGFQFGCSRSGRPGKDSPIYCSCLPPRRRRESHAQRLAAAQKVTTMEILSEIIPGNNNTLTSLFEMRCEKGKQHVACSQVDCGFACGCHNNWDITDVGTDDLQESETGAALKEELYGSEGDLESGDTTAIETTYSDFTFQIWRLLICRLGYQWKCCWENCHNFCFCAPFGFQCPIQDLKDSGVSKCKHTGSELK
jgi:hypothetical protein